jgi:hypothetical protein
MVSTQRTAYGLFVTGSNGLQVWGRTFPPGLYLRPLRVNPGQLSSARCEAVG